ncbi:MAG: Hydrogenase expression/formation protein (Maturation factor) [Acetothermia bacterium 64_32]|nr:MAG: Hydrogenase expression/formation protein (Maturation factor) [Acetothermia bacterium 64_32]MBC7099656.1 hydrogenase formation protein HypD [Candidatus Bipolaricaulota bacterium]HAF70737.1 hydrogenase formation protein HypD [Candidatus Acetothermia bacterium]
MPADPFTLRDRTRAERFARLFRRLGPDRPVKIVHVCGTHEITISQHGLRSLLPENVEVLEGPGCPVCVTSTADLDCALKIVEKGAILCSFGDMMRVPGSELSLAEAKAQGADVRMVLSAADAVEVARKNPTRKVVFFAVGFETTAPGTAAVLLDSPPPNFSVLVSHKLIPPALEALMRLPDVRIDAFLAPGHVSTIIGSDAYRPIAERYGVPVVVGGFEPLDVLYALALILRQIREGRGEVENAYRRAVLPQGNVRARELMKKAFLPCDAHWRGIGTIPSSGLALRPELSRYDARERFGVEGRGGEETAPGCLCADVLVARAVPSDCPLFGKICTPLSPVGPCMVGSEGACNVWYRYGGRSGL